MNEVRQLRAETGLTQAELAAAAGTSQPAIAAYESGRKSPTMRTLRRIAEGAGREAVVRFVPPLTREDRRSLHLHRALAARLQEEPEPVLRTARRNLRVMIARNPEARPLLEEWRRVIRRSVDDIVAVMTDPGMHARDLRQVTPFGGVLSAAERAAVYREFRVAEVAS